MRSKKSKYLIIIPTYNEKKNVSLIIEKINKRVKFKCDVLFVDDNSTDGTLDLINNQIKKNDNIKLILNNNKMGVGSAHLDAINYGSTFLRIGTNIFGERK